MVLEGFQRIANMDVSRETFDRISSIVILVADETTRQNLIAESTIEDIWERHILDSIQLLKFGIEGSWLDLGTGAGFPGLVIAAALPSFPVILVEERRLRHEFLSKAAIAVGLENVRVIGSRLERVDTFRADNICARAFAPLGKIFDLSARFSNGQTRWILPKGRKAGEELESLRTTWHGDFRLEPSVTDPTSSIIIAENVSRKGRQ